MYWCLEKFLHPHSKLIEICGLNFPYCIWIKSWHLFITVSHMHILELTLASKHCQSSHYREIFLPSTWARQISYHHNLSVNNQYHLCITVQMLIESQSSLLCHISSCNLSNFVVHYSRYPYLRLQAWSCVYTCSSHTLKERSISASCHAMSKLKDKADKVILPKSLLAWNNDY